MKIIDDFLGKWAKYFGKAPLPIAFYFSDDHPQADYAGVPPRWRCFVCDLGKVRRGLSLYFDVDSITCTGGKRYSGFSFLRYSKFRWIAVSREARSLSSLKLG